MRRRLVGLSAVLLLLFGVAACGDAEPDDASAEESSSVDMGDEIPGVQVSGELGKMPEVEIETPLDLAETTAETVIAGEGDQAARGEDVLLHLYVANGTTGEKALSSHDQEEPVPLKLSEEQLFPALVDAVAGKPVGSRVAVAALPEDGYGEAGAEQLGISPGDSVVFVADVISVKPTDVLDGPSGEEVENTSDLPTIEEANGEVTGLSWEDAPAEPPKQLEMTTLIEGDGEPIRDDSLVTMDYVGQVYGAEEPFNNSYPQEPATFALGVGQLIPGWDSSLLGVTKGSRVLLSIPPEEGYGVNGNPSIDVKGDDTLVFLVDVLGVG